MPMIGDEEWKEPQLFVAETTQAIRRQLAIVVLPLVVIVAAFALWGIAPKDKSQLADARDQHPGAATYIDQR